MNINHSTHSTDVEIFTFVDNHLLKICLSNCDETDCHYRHLHVTVLSSVSCELRLFALGSMLLLKYLHFLNQSRIIFYLSLKCFTLDDDDDFLCNENFNV